MDPKDSKNGEAKVKVTILEPKGKNLCGNGKNLDGIRLMPEEKIENGFPELPRKVEEDENNNF